MKKYRKFVRFFSLYGLFRPFKRYPRVTLFVFVVIFVSVGIMVVERAQANTEPTTAACQRYIYGISLSNKYVPCVKAIQEMLNGIHAANPSIFHGNYLIPDGSYGPLTQAAVVDFQTSRNSTVHPLVLNGIVGPPTWPLLCLAADEVLGKPGHIRSKYLHQLSDGAIYSRCGF